MYDGYSKDNQLLWLQAYDNVIEEGEAPVVAAPQAYGTVKRAKRDAELARCKDRTLHSFWASDRRPVQHTIEKRRQKKARHTLPRKRQQRMTTLSVVQDEKGARSLHIGQIEQQGRWASATSRDTQQQGR